MASLSSLAPTPSSTDPDFSTPFLLELRKVFDMFDADSDGGLDCQELQKVFRQLGLAGDNEEKFRERVANIIRANDLDGDGKLQWVEFVDLMRRNVNVDYRSIFDQFFDHRDGNGQIDSQELKTILMRLGSDVSDSEIALMMSTADQDGDGQIDFEEFLQLLKSRDTPSLLSSDQGIIIVMSTHKEKVKSEVSGSSIEVSTSTSSTSIITSQQLPPPPSTNDDTVVRSSSLKALLSQIPKLPQDLGLGYRSSSSSSSSSTNTASMMRLKALVKSPEFATVVKPALQKGRGRPRKIPPGWLHSEGGEEGHTEEVWLKLSREKQAEAQATVKKRLIAKRDELRREREEKKRAKTASRSTRADEESESIKRQKIVEEAESVAMAQVAKWEQEALINKLLDDHEGMEHSSLDNDDNNDDVGAGNLLGSAISRVPSFSEETAESEVLAEVLGGFTDSDHLLLEFMVTKARDVDGSSFDDLSSFTVRPHWDDVEAHRAAAQRWFSVVLRAQVMSAVWNSGSSRSYSARLARAPSTD